MRQSTFCVELSSPVIVKASRAKESLLTVEGTRWLTSGLSSEVDEVVWQRLHIQPSNGVREILHPALRQVWGRRTEPVDVP